MQDRGQEGTVGAALCRIVASPSLAYPERLHGMGLKALSLEDGYLDAFFSGRQFGRATTTNEREAE